MPEVAIGYHALALADNTPSGPPMQTISRTAKYWLTNNKLLLSALAAVGSFAFFLAHQAWHFPAISDDIFVATTAKNAAFGHGWVSSHGELLPFDPEISTGPGLLGFLVIGIKLFGNTLWLPRVFSLGLNLVLATLLLWRLQRWLEPRTFLWLLVLLPLAYANVRHDMWITALGDMPVVLYSALAAMLAFEGMESGRRRFMLAAGLSAGLALLTKTVALMPIAGILLLPWFYMLPGMPAPRRSAQQWLWLLVGITLPVLPWLLYQKAVIAGLPTAQAIYLQQESQRVFLHMGSGVGRLLDAWQSHGLTGVWDSTKINVTRNIPRFNNELDWKLGPIPWPFMVFLGALLSAVAASLHQSHKPLQRLHLALLLPTLPYLAWLIFVSDWIFGRHAYIGILLGLIGLLAITAGRPRMAPALAIYLALLTLFWPVADINFGKLYRIHSEPHAVREPLQALIGVLERDYPDATLAGCGYQIAREVEYALPSVNRIVDCHRLIGEITEFDHPAFINRYPDLAGLDHDTAIQHLIADKQRFLPRGLVAPVRWTGQIEFILIDYPVARWFGRRDTTLGTLIDYCSETLYSNDFYSLHRCGPSDLENYASALGGLGFAPPQWQVQLWLAEHKRLTGLPAH